MAKQQRSIKQTQVLSKAGKGQQLEHTEVFDDSLLPEASEIEKLKALDPTIIDWLKERAAAEQDFRHKAVNRKMNIVEKAERGARRINILGMLFAFIILALGMAFSYGLLMHGHVITGSCFGGFTLLFGAKLFLDNGSKPTKTKPANQKPN